MIIRGIAYSIVAKLQKRTNELGQGRSAGCIGFIDENHYVICISEIVDGGLSGLPVRSFLGTIAETRNLPIIEMLEQLPDNAVIISTRPGQTGLIVNVAGVNFFDLPVINIGVKEDKVTGVGIMYPKAELFDMATEMEKIDLETLKADTMEEEKRILRRTAELDLQAIEMCEELRIVNGLAEQPWSGKKSNPKLRLPRLQVTSLDRGLAERLVQRSLEIGQGREVACIGLVDDRGHVTGKGEIVEGGIGYVPSRVLASSIGDISGKSMRQIYSKVVPENAVIVHTHPGGTGVMHAGDASAGPQSWGRPIIAIGCDKTGRIRGATVIEVSEKLFALALEDEELDLKFYQAQTSEDETEIRNRKFAIAQEYTNLCKPIKII